MSRPQASWGHPEWVDYFRNTMMESVRTDVRHLLSSRGAFGVPRQFFPHVEYLSGLVFGPVPTGHNLADTARTDQFLDQYLGRVDPLYRQHRRILLGMWRHGVIHTYQPKLLTNGTRLLDWLSYQGARVNAHVVLPDVTLTVSHLTPLVGPDTLDLFPVANNCLVDDLEAVLRLIVTDLEVEAAGGGTTPLLQHMRDAANRLAQPTQGQPIAGVPAPFNW